MTGRTSVTANFAPRTARCPSWQFIAAMERLRWADEQRARRRRLRWRRHRIAIHVVAPSRQAGSSQCSLYHHSNRGQLRSTSTLARMDLSLVWAARVTCERFSYSTLADSTSGRSVPTRFGKSCTSCPKCDFYLVAKLCLMHRSAHGRKYPTNSTENAEREARILKDFLTSSLERWFLHTMGPRVAQNICSNPLC
ncbi:hypothetical protein GY45DRAFT_141819 [Cubamyces sp. BRFM 1775]|nr:hypothetical protein GY45DRAFT_141819 [Cubamyces sp. BRFM 1775]